MADGYDKLKKAMETDWRNGDGMQVAQAEHAKAIESLVTSGAPIPDALVHRESHSEMEKADK